MLSSLPLVILCIAHLYTSSSCLKLKEGLIFKLRSKFEDLVLRELRCGPLGRSGMLEVFRPSGRAPLSPHYHGASVSDSNMKAI
jgi:hypothetical protein